MENTVAYFEDQLRQVARGQLDMVNLEQASFVTGKPRSWWMNRAAGLHTSVVFTNGTTIARKHS